MAKPTKAEFAAWLLILGPIPREQLRKYNQSRRWPTYDWLEKEMFKAGIIKRVSDHSWHTKVVTYYDWYLEQERINDKVEQQEEARPRERFPQAI